MAAAAAADAAVAAAVPRIVPPARALARHGLLALSLLSIAAHRLAVPRVRAFCSWLAAALASRTTAAAMAAAAAAPALAALAVPVRPRLHSSLPVARACRRSSAAPPALHLLHALRHLRAPRRIGRGQARRRRLRVRLARLGVPEMAAGTLALAPCPHLRSSRLTRSQDPPTYPSSRARVGLWHERWRRRPRVRRAW